MTNAFNESTIVVTGAASGIGKKTAELLMGAGAKVVALDRVAPTYPVYRFIQVDLSEKESIDAAVTALEAEAIFGLCNIAGVPGTLSDDMVARINYLGLRHLTTSLLPRIQRGGSIVNVASVAGFKWRDHAKEYFEFAMTPDWSSGLAWIKEHPFLSVEAYRRFKEALVVWNQAHAGPWMQQFGVRMNCVSPGPVETPILNDFRQSLGHKNVADLIELTGRPGTPEDIAPVITFLLSEAAKWLVGIEITTDGGLSSSRFYESSRASAA